MPRKRDEPVRLTKIYTRGGDRGETSLGDGSRVSEARPAHRGLRRCRRAELAPRASCSPATCPDDIRAVLDRVQNELFDVGADLSVPFAGHDDRLRVAQSQVDQLEADCDRFNAELPELKSFVLPGGTESAALHPRRARGLPPRRARRRSWRHVNPLALVYLNRLSDLLFILARAANAAAGRDEPLWKPGASR